MYFLSCSYYFLEFVIVNSVSLSYELPELFLDWMLTPGQCPRDRRRFFVCCWRQVGAGFEGRVVGVHEIHMGRRVWKDEWEGEFEGLKRG